MKCGVVNLETGTGALQICRQGCPGVGLNMRPQHGKSMRHEEDPSHDEYDEFKEAGSQRVVIKDATAG